MTGTIRNKPTRRTFGKGLIGRRAARTRVRASTYRDSARKRLDHRHERREHRAHDLPRQADLLHRNWFDEEFDFAYLSKWTEKMDKWYGSETDNFELDESLRFNFDEEVAKQEEQRMLDLTLSIGCNI